MITVFSPDIMLVERRRTVWGEGIVEYLSSILQMSAIFSLKLGHMICSEPRFDRLSA
jgi:hypothetical protein